MNQASQPQGGGQPPSGQEPSFLDDIELLRDALQKVKFVLEQAIDETDPLVRADLAQRFREIWPDIAQRFREIDNELADPRLFNPTFERVGMVGRAARVKFAQIKGMVSRAWRAGREKLPSFTRLILRSGASVVGSLAVAMPASHAVLEGVREFIEHVDVGVAELQELGP